MKLSRWSLGYCCPFGVLSYCCCPRPGGPGWRTARRALARALLLHLRLVAAVAAVRVAAVVVVAVVVPRRLLLQRPLRVGLMERSG